MDSVGRPPIYDKNYHPHVLCSLFWENPSITPEKVAEKFGIGKSTLHEWCNTHKEFMDSWAMVTAGIKGLMINTALKEATGYHFYDETLDKHGEVRELRKWARPQANILKLLLSNFGIREKTEVINKTELSDDLMNKAVKKLSDDELEQLHVLINKIED